MAVELSRRSFWDFCQTLAPEFYTDDRPHLKIICDTLQALYESRIVRRPGEKEWQIIPGKREPGWQTCKKLMLNIPPQHGKTRTLVNFSSWVFGDNPKEKIITGSYNNDTASDFSRYTRDNIAMRKNMDTDLVYRDIFPNTRIKQGHSGYEKWALEGNHFSYMGVGVGGSVTSKGATILMVDDPVKGAAEAMNMNNLDATWLWYTGTFKSRVSAAYGEPIEIICMTRWSSEDICGRILKKQEEEGKNDWYVLKMAACLNESNGEMLCPSLFSFNRYKELKGLVVDMIFNANYKQETMEASGLLFYRNDLNFFKRSDLGKQVPEAVVGYIDVADAGDDSLSFPIGKVFKNKVFVTDVVFTKDLSDITLPLCAGLIKDNNVQYTRVETNSMGRIFAKDLRDLVGVEKVLTINNSTAKHTRIMMTYGFIKNYFYFLDRSEYEPGSDYDKFMNGLLNYMKNGSSKIDDAPDSASGLAFFIQSWLPHLFT
jgi:hypothetical protein